MKIVILKAVEGTALINEDTDLSKLEDLADKAYYEVKVMTPDTLPDLEEFLAQEL